MKYLILIFFLAFALPSTAQEKQDTLNDIRFRASAGLNFYRAFSQKKNSMVMKMGYPVFKGAAFNAGGKIIWSGQKVKHHLNLDVSHLPTIISDDGLGNNFLLQKNKSHLTSILLEHQMERTLFNYQSLDMNIAPLAGLDFQHRNITYMRKTSEQTTDINLFIGIRTVPRFHINNALSIQAGFDSFFYLPYLNTGRLKKWDSKKNLVEKSTYHAFYYRTRLHASIKYKMNNGKNFRLGYRNEKTVGFANSKPLFYIEKLIHHRMDRHHNFFVEYEF
ncbi:MAG: hypothetical protein ACQESM_09070 [Bacteroidota bacterium]